ncbi:hypothetical protein F5Y05DRAFT_122232 [Hypoxylon sp. FL0543]|nr:hypothetical protein F5Y05DRAFT_122232 [Hypoxylon sp. FL0543]
MDTQSLPFSPERCADLHNELLARSIERRNQRDTERNLAARFLDAAPEFAEIPSLHEIPLYRFLALLNTTPISHGRVGLLTPQFYQPDPTTFWSETFDHEPSFILLYGQNNGDSPMDGGIFLDIKSYRAVWHGGKSPRFPPTDHWVPLEVILKKSLDAWEAGKFYWDASQDSIAIRRWTQNDVEQSLLAWDRLLSSIELSISSKVGHSPVRLRPLSPELLARFKISGFAAEFLTRAQQPGFTFIAPGISTFTSQSFIATYEAEAPGSERQTHWLGDSGDHDWPTLLFPGPDVVPHDISRSPDLEINSFDRDWGFGKFTVNRQSGLYVMADTENSDVVRLIASSGLPSACEFRYPCPWGPHRSPRLAEVLRHWTSLVENGAWLVGPNGICTDHEWFTTNTSTSKIPLD